MGKIRIKTLGSDRDEKMQAVLAEKRRAAKRAKKMQDDAAAGSILNAGTDEAGQVEGSLTKEGAGLEGGEVASQGTDQGAGSESEGKDGKKSTNKKTARKSSAKTARYTKMKAKIDDNKSYALSDAVTLLKTVASAKFDETLEVHVNLTDASVKGEVLLPHGTGKDVRVALLDDKVLAAIDSGVFDFDILISSPSDMAKLVKYARVLGPKGLMPNPKKGTVSENPAEAAKKFQGGNVHYKSEPKAPLIHQAVGKVSLKEEALVENVGVFLKALGKKNMIEAYLTTTMSPSVRLDISQIK